MTFQLGEKISPQDVVKMLRVNDQAIRKIRENCDQIRARCTHVGCISYSPDPSGNNDSSYDCSACGRSWRRWPKDVPQEE